MRCITAARMVLCFTLVGSLAGCSTGSIESPSAAPVSYASAAASGRVFGGQQPVNGASLQLYTVGTGGDGSSASPLLPAGVVTRADGTFTLPSYSCSSATQVYLVATGGIPGGTVANPNLSLMAALGPCTSLSQSTFININEMTTVAAVAALAPYMTSITAIGSATGDSAALASAFTLAYQFANTATGTVPGLNIPSGYTAPSAVIATLGNILASCVNSTGGLVNSNTPCGILFGLTTPAGGTAATETAGAMLNLTRNPTLNTVSLFGRAPAQDPFAGALTQPPPDFSVRLTRPASAMPLQLSVSSLAFASTAVGYASQAQTVTLTNTSSSSITLSPIAITGTNAGDFAQSGACGATLQALANCTVQIAFSPSAPGTRLAYLGVTSSTPDSPQYVALNGSAAASGTGPILSLSASSLSLTQAAVPTSNVGVSSTTNHGAITVTNTGTASLTVSGISLKGVNANNFTETDTCSGTIAPQGACTITVTFAPFLAVAHSATMTIASTAGLPQSVNLVGTGTGSVTLNTSNATKWVITNGFMTYEWDPATGHVTAVYWNNSSGNSLIDGTTQSNGYPSGLYMDNTGTNLGSSVNTYGYTFGPNNAWLDVYYENDATSTVAFTQTQHIVFTANDTGFHAYTTLNHTASAVAGNIGQWQYVFRVDLNKFTSTYSYNSGLGNLGAMTIPQPSTTDSGNTDPGRAVSNAVTDLHGFNDIPAGFVRGFYTKYDYASYEYLHQAHGVYGSTYGAWVVLPSDESAEGGPTKQNLIFTNNILIQEPFSGHFVSNIDYTPPQGVTTTRICGPYYFHFNQFTAAHATPDSLYTEALSNLPSFNFLYDNLTPLLNYGYVPSTARGTVAGTIANGGSATPNTAWTVLSDPGKNFQYSSNGNQYWTSNGATGSTQLANAVPGTYRLSSYVLGQWGELRKDNITVAANQTTVLPPLTFTPENFGPSVPIWTIGTPDRSGHEFLHGHDSSGNDFRNFWGAYNFWADFASTSGTQVYYATAVGSIPATNNPNGLNYNQWGTFDPGLFGGVYNAADDTTDGYNYVIPAYVASLPGATGTNGVGTNVPPAAIHFTTNGTQLAQGQYSVASIALGCTENDVFAILNGHQLIWHAINPSDCMVRSGLSGYTQWIAFQWPTSYLNAAGVDNVLTLGSNHAEGVTWDAIRFEITNTSADPVVTGWHDYEYLYGSTYTPANDALPNN
jgi:hypothetical protein